MNAQLEQTSTSTNHLISQVSVAEIARRKKEIFTIRENNDETNLDTVLTKNTGFIIFLLLSHSGG